MVDDLPPSTGAPRGGVVCRARPHPLGRGSCEYACSASSSCSCSCSGTRSSSPPSTRSSPGGGAGSRSARDAVARGARTALAADGRPGPLHLHGPGRDHRLRDPARRDRRAAASRVSWSRRSRRRSRFLIAFAILTYLSVVLGELVPKAVALQKAEPLAIALAIPLDWLARLTHPLVWRSRSRRTSSCGSCG